MLPERRRDRGLWQYRKKKELQNIVDKVWKDLDEHEDRARVYELMVDREDFKQDRTPKPPVPFNTVTSKIANQKKQELASRKKAIKLAKEQGYEQALEELLPMAALLQKLAMERAAGQARVSDDTYDPQAPDAADLDRALKVAEAVANRVKGRPTTRVESNTTHSFLLKLEESGELD